MKIYAENSGEMKPINFASAVIDLFYDDPAINHNRNKAREDIKEIALHLLTWYCNTSKEEEEDEG